MTVRRQLVGIGLAAAIGAFSLPADAGVVVLNNEAPSKVTLTLIQPDGRQSQHCLERWEVLPVPAVASVAVVFNDGAQRRRCVLQADGIYDFNSDGEKLSLSPYPLPGLQLGASSPPPRNALFTIPVKILVDDKEPSVRQVWEKRYRDRLVAASEIIERHCRVRFEPVAFATWTSQDEAGDMRQLIEEFDRKVDPAPARLAIGFTGQYKSLQDDKHMGGTRGAFCPRILIREWGRRIAEPERLEILVHELGHYLGAAHSPEHHSVMRPDIGDRQSRSRSFRIAFDSRNTLIMYLVGEELRRGPFGGFDQLSPVVKNPLRAAYTSLAAALPDDLSAPKYLGLLNQPF